MRVEGPCWRLALFVGNQGSLKNSNSHIDASHSRQPLVKGERLVRYEVNAVMLLLGDTHRGVVDWRATRYSRPFLFSFFLRGLFLFSLFLQQPARHCACLVDGLALVLFMPWRCIVGSCSEASYLKRNSAMDDSIGGS